MDLTGLLERFALTEALGEIRRALDDRRPYDVGGLWGGAAACLLAALFRRPSPGRVLVVTADEDLAEDLAGDLALFLDDPDIARTIPAFDTFDGIDSDGGRVQRTDYTILAGRLLALQRLLDGTGPAYLVAPVAAILQPVIAPARLAAARRSLSVGDRVDLTELSASLVEAGFSRVSMVETPGEFSVRGGIMDVFPISREAPYRLELFDDEVDSIRQFEPGTQRSVGTVGSLKLTLLPPPDLTRPEGGANLLDYLPADRVVAVHEEHRIREWIGAVDARESGAGLARRLSRLLTTLRENGRLAMTTRPLPAGVAGAVIPVRSVTGGAKSIDEFEEILAELAGRSRYVLLFANNEAERTRLEGILTGAGTPAFDRVEVAVGRLSRSFHLPELELTFLSHDEVFDRHRLRRVARRAKSAPVADFVDLGRGDTVVHVAHGIGVFRGLERIVKRGETEEFLKVEFADDVVVYVPVTKASLVQKYIGSRDFRPRLSKVGAATWTRQKERVRDAVRDLAADLLEIQAVRETKPGIAYPPDDRMQIEFEASFLYEDTPDQIDANAAIKDDMHRPRPMDRLLCGDVGYGKTELAIRAAFKAVTAGKQVAVLVPTTVLAQQHYQTFCERLVAYPVNVEVLSRFRSPADAKEVVERTARGGVDILIGTHRLLSKDVAFADLGLVIVDEEQRFGVGHKTRLRQLRKTVDVLTMTATPIPRTLHLALLGIKDISTLATAPPGRQSILTEVIEFDEERIRAAILREINRGGQVFFVHNRVETIDRMAAKLKRIAPEARYAVVHGQMREHELERGMLAFLRRDVDVLVTTTIIESGLDIPNANTIFMDGVDRFGLAEMHQLRGRVGRYRHRAYCYLIVPPRRISTVAERRIRAVEEFQELGAGFRIAMRDLEIRGAGNILGSQQSGHIAAVGYELFCQLLEEAVEQLREARSAERIDSFVELDVGAHLPLGYIPDDKLKIEVYRKLSGAASAEALEAAVDEVEDRFGALPEAARLLVEVSRVRLLASELGIQHLVRIARDRVQIRPTDMRRLLDGLEPQKDRVRVIDEHTVHLLLADPREGGLRLLDDLRNALRAAGREA